MFFRKKRTINLLELVPVKVFGSTAGGDGLIVVDMPRFHVAWMNAAIRTSVRAVPVTCVLQKPWRYP